MADRERPRPRAHEVALAIAGPTEDAVLAAVAKHWLGGCEPHELPSELLVDLRGALQRELRVLLEDLARLSDPHAFGLPRPLPLADVLEPSLPPPPPLPASASPSQRPTAPPPADWDDITPMREPGYELTGDIRRLLDPRPTGRTLSSHPPPPPMNPMPRDQPPTGRLKPPPIPDVLSQRLRRQKPGPHGGSQ